MSRGVWVASRQLIVRRRKPSGHIVTPAKARSYRDIT
jgi:hypothetical protein